MCQCKYEVDTVVKVVTEILYLGGLGLRLRLGLVLILLGSLSLYYYAHSITPW